MTATIELTTNYPELTWTLHAPNGEPIGRAEALDGETVWLNRISIPVHRGHGYATILLKAVLGHFPDVTIGLAAVPPSTSAGLNRAELQAWYERHGFQPAPQPGDPDRMIHYASRP